MEMLVVLAITVVVFFVWQGLRTRCPVCGVMALHVRDRLAEDEQRQTFKSMQETGMLEALDRAGSSLGSGISKPGYVNALFSCKACGHQFKRQTAIEWLAIRNKVGEEKALSEYKKLEKTS